MIRKLTLLPFVFALASLGLVFAQPSQGRQFAFLVACGDYDKTQLEPVPFTVAEMKVFRQVLIDSGVAEKNIVFLHDKADAFRFTPTRENILKQFKLLMERLKPEDSVVVALSGHGVQYKGDKYGYFCPLDAELGEKKKHKLLAMEGEDGLLTLLDKGKAGRKLLIVNACRNKPASNLNLAAEKLQLADEYNEEAPKGTVMLLACKQGQFSWFYDEKEKRTERRNRSLFMYHLTEAWKGTYAKGKKVTVDHLIAEVTARVEEDAPADFNRNQIPIVKRKLEGQWDLAAAVLAKNITNSLGMKLVYVAPGKFTMGSPKSEQDYIRKAYGDYIGDIVLQEKQHEVELTNGFYMGVYTVTQEEYETMMGKNPSHFSARGEGRKDVAGIDTRRFPVEKVSWEDAKEFCKKLAAKEGKAYRLPSEAEWEYACRAGTTTPFHFGETISTDQANYNGNYAYGNGKQGAYRKRPVPVGSFSPNAWGLHDMHGNVDNWCEDWLDNQYYSKSPKTNPLNETKDTWRVVRGGSWAGDTGMCRSANRRQGYLNWTVGFRVVLPAP